MKTRMVSARLEGALVDRYEEAEEAAPEENKSAFLRSLIVDGLDEKDRDALDAIGADDGLRVTVEDRREDGEPLDDAVRRLVREGAEVSTTTAKRRERAHSWAEATILGMAAMIVAFAAFGDALTQPLPFVSVTGESVMGLTFFFLLSGYVWNRAPTLLEAIAARGKADRGSGGDE